MPDNELMPFSDPLREIREEDVELLVEKTQPFQEMMMYYSCALKEVSTKFEVLNNEFNVRYHYNPVETIKTRLKQPLHILEKMRRKGYPISVSSVREHIFDIAGVRVICSFPEDIYKLVEMFTRQDDVMLIQEKDYIRHPKENGYRSYHLIVEIPIFLSDKVEPVRAEVQFRTIAMDFWASLEHKMKYKKHLPNADEITSQLKECAGEIAQMDLRMQDIRHRIESEFAGEDDPLQFM